MKSGPYASLENPDSKRHVLATDLSHMINLAAWGTEGDGIPEIVLAHEFANESKNSVGSCPYCSMAWNRPNPGRSPKSTAFPRRTAALGRHLWQPQEGAGEFPAHGVEGRK